LLDDINQINVYLSLNVYLNKNILKYLFINIYCKDTSSNRLY
jgi:hypothetical protein